MIKIEGKVVTPNQAAKVFVHQWGAESVIRWKDEYKDFDNISSLEVKKIEEHILKHIARIGKFLTRKNVSTDESIKNVG